MPAKSGSPKQGIKKVATKIPKKAAGTPPAVESTPAPDCVRVVGYGTFITRGMFERYPDIELCRVTGFRRVYPPRSSYPFALPASAQEGFWALVFNVPAKELSSLDVYEGVPALYLRHTVTVQLKSGTKIKAEMYVASASMIRDMKLSTTMDPSDRYREVIRQKVPELIKKYPELVEHLSE